MDLEYFERHHVRPRAGRTLLVGSKLYETSRRDRREEMFPDFLGLDMLPGDGVDLVWDLETPVPDLKPFDHIECLSVLEHVRRPWLMAQNIERLLVEDGTLYLRVPFVWRVHAYPSDYFRFTVEGAKSLFGLMDWDHALFFTHESVRGTKVPSTHIGDLPYMARTEVVLFGRRKRRKVISVAYN